LFDVAQPTAVQFKEGVRAWEARFHEAGKQLEAMDLSNRTLSARYEQEAEATASARERIAAKAEVVEAEESRRQKLEEDMQVRLGYILHQHLAAVCCQSTQQLCLLLSGIGYGNCAVSLWCS
jgi:hypothetical protein